MVVTAAHTKRHSMARSDLRIYSKANSMVITPHTIIGREINNDCNMSAKVILYGQTTKKMNFLPICVPVEASHEEPKKHNKSCFAKYLQFCNRPKAHGTYLCIKNIDGLG